MNRKAQERSFLGFLFGYCMTVAANSEQLQSSELFINLQYEIAGTENHMATERMRDNQAVRL